MNCFDALKASAGEDSVLCKEPMSRHTTLGIGGPADYFVTLTDKDALKNTLAVLNEYQIPYYIIGRGSNLLVADRGYNGAILLLAGEFQQVSINGNLVTAGAGIAMKKLSDILIEHSLSGFEFGAGIPGTLGGALTMNAGAYGGEMVQIVKDAQVITPDGQELTLSNEELALGYRKSCIKENDYIVLRVNLVLHQGDKEEIRLKVQELANRRREKQPLHVPSAGSTFKRPKGHFAGKLIMDAGLRGFRVGGVSVSEKHCGFVVNDQNGSAEDFINCCRQIIETVKEHSGVTMEMEIKTLGEFKANK